MALIGEAACVTRGRLIKEAQYVALNPVRGELVERAGDWRWSSGAPHLAGRDATFVSVQRPVRRHASVIVWPLTRRSRMERGLDATKLTLTTPPRIASTRRRSAFGTASQGDGAWLDQHRLRGRGHGEARLSGGYFDAVVSVLFFADIVGMTRELYAWSAGRPPRGHDPGTENARAGDVLIWDVVHEIRPDLVPAVSPWDRIVATDGSIAILRNCRRAMPDGAKVLVLERMIFADPVQSVFTRCLATSTCW